MYRSKSFYCPFCHAGPFPKRVALASHISQRAQCSAAALAQAHKHINPPVDDGPSIVASQSPPTLVFNNPSEPLELESDRSPSPNSQPPKRPRDDDPQSSHFNPFTLLFPGEKSAGQAYDYHGTPFEQEFQSQVELGKEPWDPFADAEEWELADWFMTAEVAQEDIDKYLKLKIVRAGGFFVPKFACWILTWTQLLRHASEPKFRSKTSNNSSRRSMLSLVVQDGSE